MLATKLFAPARRSQTVARTRLGEQLDTTLDPGHRLTLLSAPAGFGKTTALSNWVAGLGESGSHVAVAWLSLDEGDNDPARLLAHLAATLAATGMRLEAPVDIRGPGADVGAAMTALINDVALAGQAVPDKQWVLVFDDYHAINALEVHEAMSFLLEHLPDQLRLVVATRSDPPLPVARLRARGQITELRGADLRFTRPEAREFLNAAMGLALDDADVDALEGRTEGWITGLQLAALSLRNVPDRREVVDFIEAFTGSNRFVLDYLADEVLARQPPGTREFLLRTAVLDRLTGSLCDAVLDGSGGSAMLEDLERENLFLVPLDADRSWYRYHHLFADVLAARLLAEQPELAVVLHRRASSWYASRGLVESAVRHAMAGEDFTTSAQLIEEALPTVRRARQDKMLLGWISRLPDSVVASSPVLSMVSAWAHLMAGELEEVEPRLDDAEAALKAGARDPERAAAWADTEDLRSAPGNISIYRAALAQARGDVAGVVRNARRALELAADDDHLVRGGADGYLGLAAWAEGRIAEAVAVFSTAVEQLHSAGNFVDEMDASIVLADMWVAAGRPSRARRLLEKSLRAAVEGGEPYPRATADLHVSLAELDRELDDLLAAEAHLETARVLAERGSITENRHRWYLVMALVCATRADLDTAMTLLDRAAERYRRGFSPDVRPIAAMKARLQIAGGDVESAAVWAQESRLGLDDSPDFLREYENLTLVRLVLARHRLDQQPDPPLARGLHRRSDQDAATSLAAARRQLERLLEAAAAARRDGSLLEIRMLQALLHDASGDRASALAGLVEALSKAPEPEAYVRLFLDEGAPMRDLLHAAAETSGGDVGRGTEAEPTEQARSEEMLRAWCGGLLQRAEAAVTNGHAPQPTLPSQPLVEPLSQRELEVLRLLATDRTGPEIAGELYVSLNTLRTHTKRIFTKLDVKTRAAAVRSAREHSLLDG